MTLPVRDPVVVVAIVAGVIVASPILLARYRIPGIIGVLVAGAVLGPNALGVLARDQAIVLLGTMGLIYIMFTAALEIDLAVLKASRVQSIGTGLVAFALPQVIGTAVAYYALDFRWATAVLLGSTFASHTLVAYPVISRLGLTKHRAVTAAVGGTIVTDTLTLTVLAVVASTAHGELSRAFWIELVISMAVYFGGILLLVPQLARWFFRNVQPDGPVEFMFVLATVFTCAGFAYVAGVEPIVGAFLAGLALNRSIPHQSPLMNRIQFTGDALFVPFFLLSVGMLLDARVFLAGFRSWLVTIVMVGGAVGGKYLASRVVRLVFRYNRTEADVIFGLSLAQAAATLATILVGFRIGLFNENVVNGGIMLILVTCIASPIITDRRGRALALAEEQAPSEGQGHPQRILLSLSNADTAPPLVDLGLLLRDEAQHEPIYPFTVVRDQADSKAAVAYAEKMLSHAVVHCTSADVPSSPVTRIDHNVAAALSRARRDLRASDIVIGWGARPTAQARLFGSFLDHLLEGRDFTLWMARLRIPLNTISRLVLCVPPLALREPGFAPVVHVIKRMASRLSAPFVIHAVRSEEQALVAQLGAIKPELAHQFRPLDTWASLVPALAEDVSDRDLIVLYCARPGSLAYRARGEQVAQRIAGRFGGNNLLVVYPGEPASSDPVARVAALPPVFLRRGRIVLGLDQLSLQQAVRTLLEKGLAGAGRPREAEVRVLAHALIASATRLGNSVVLLHTTWARPDRAVLVGTSPEGIARDGEPPIHLVFAVLSQIGYDPQSHLNLLADIARIAANPGLVERAVRAEHAQDVLAVLAGRPAPQPVPEAIEDKAPSVPLAEP